ncbi:EamA family transporter RarD [Saxibacter everestensis]|uniref:EamA family transporter RarD n=1 Tax=Saxibacter everestensis TaxID=2909229 RepID=A0ABY8QRC5_9MICO|nr:EamA family transporter RarD [Brevibacteriaceae bacterium ZFBP1038]
MSATPSSSNDPAAAAAPTSGTDEAQRRERKTGLLLGMTSYLCWGVIPLYFALLEPAGSIEIVAQRVVWSLLLCVILLFVVRGFRRTAVVLRKPKLFGVLAAASAFVAINWLGFIFGVQTHRVVEVSLGYFINPLFTVLLGVVFLKEKLNRLQWLAMAIGALAVLVIAIGYGRAPWLSLLVAGSFGLYGLMKNRVGRTVDAVAGLSIETMILSPIALGYLIWLEASGNGTFTSVSPGHTALLIGLGVVTAVPLLLFSAAARRVPLSWIGMLQYIAPVMQFVFGITVFGEHMPLARWIGFCLVWSALVVLSIDMMTRSRRRPRPVAPA